MKEINLHDTFDAVVWAEEFMRIFGNKKESIDDDLMLGWFANALMAGYDFANRKIQEDISQRTQREINLRTDWLEAREEITRLKNLLGVVDMSTIDTEGMDNQDEEG